MSSIKRFIFIFLLFASSFSFAAIAKPSIATIKGCNKEYASKSVSVYKYADYITKIEEKIATVNFDKHGCFTISFPCEKITEIFIHFGVYRCFAYVIPNKTLEINIPPYEPKTLEEELNPYFTPVDISLGILGDTVANLNMDLLEFNNTYETFVEENFRTIYFLRDKNIIDSLEAMIDSVFATAIKNPFFNTYKKYHIQNLRYMTYQRDHMVITRNSYLHAPMAYNNPAYMLFFTQLWSNYINNNHMKAMGRDMKISIIYGKSPTMFKENLEKHIALRNDTLKELLLLQCLHDSYKMPEIFPLAPVRQTLDSLILITKIQDHKDIANNIIRKFNTTKVGDTLVNFLLYNQDSMLYNLNRFRGKYVYINYGRSENYACIQDYKVMQNMNTKTQKDLHIVTLSGEKDFETFRNFKKKNPQYKWTFLYVGNNPELLKYYNLTATPSYILLDPNGKVVLLSAPTPLDNFQQVFADIIIKKRKEDAEKRKQERKYRMW